MRSDRVIPDGGGSDPFGVRIPMYSGGFGNPVMGNVRGEPSSSLPKDPPKVRANVPPAPATASPAGAALGDSTSGTPVTDAFKDHWQWLIVAGLVVAAVMWKS